ncbi:hypothetical protein HYH03_009099 [Edaphochlamys debaryana]|uniref:Uncharacterized protein n=1 Tax=Edaphochlamys debaryana TaxID=47281 RepID=A0A836BYW5_9CHLO|nr:hypothetical protein HYH03_009099 [Edaphochlamys debaryana]|eukprot:KAG2492684.1 hypothetical protein HYH03_009099 [Edaphochlamys debaryana]
MADRLRSGDLSRLGFSGRTELQATVQRSWKGEGGWNVVVGVTAAQRAEFRRRAKEVRVVSGVVVTPYLNALGRALRKERTPIFDELQAKGLAPRWFKGADILFPPTDAEAEGRLSAALGALFPSQHCQLAAVLALGCRAVPSYERVEALRVAHGELMYIVEHNHLQWGEPPHVRLQPEKYRGQLIDILLERPGRLPALARCQDPAVDRVTVLQHVLDRIGGGKPLRDWEAQHGPPTTRAQQVDALAFALRQWADFKKMGAWVTADWGSWADGPQYSNDSVLYLGITTDSYPQFYPLKFRTTDGKQVGHRYPGDAKSLLGLGFQLGAGTCCDVELPKAGPDAAAPPRVPLVPFLEQLRLAGVVAAHNAANDLPCIARELLEQGRVEDVLALVAKPARCSRLVVRHVFPRCKSASPLELCDLLTAARAQQALGQGQPEEEEDQAPAQAQGQTQGQQGSLFKRPSKSAKDKVKERAEAVRALRQGHDELLATALAGRTSEVTKREAREAYKEAMAAAKAVAAEAKGAQPKRRPAASRKRTQKGEA